MRWISVFILIAACIFCTMAGLTAGINMNPASTVSYVWDWSVAGSWASGLGALAAVVFALCQSYKQQKKERARCRISVEEGEWFFTVLVVSEGIIPTNVLGASISFDGGSNVFNLASFPKLGFIFPVKLERGDALALIDVHRDEYRRLATYLTDLAITDLRKIELTPSIHEKQKAKDYFVKLKACGERDAKLLLRTAHADMTYSLPPSLMRSIFSLVEAEQREKWEAEIEDQRKEYDKVEYLLNASDNDVQASL